MWLRLLSLNVFLATSLIVSAQERFTEIHDLRAEWLLYERDSFELAGPDPLIGARSVYFRVPPPIQQGTYLQIVSGEPYFLFLNGKLLGEYEGLTRFDTDSLLKGVHASSHWIGIHQQLINERDLRTTVVGTGKNNTAYTPRTLTRPYSSFRDFIVLAGLVIIVFFLITMRLNPKMTTDYFSVTRIFSSREADDGQVNARLTSGSNVQFYLLCSVMTGFYLLMVFYQLPRGFSLPIRFHTEGFWMAWWQWFKLSAIIFALLMAKVLIIFSLTRLFGMRGFARFHFFNWIRLLLVVVGISTIVLFMYFISRGDDPDIFVVFLSVMVVIPGAWIVLAFFKLSGRSGHSMFHLFSYLCATEIIPLLIAVKVLFQ